MNQWLVGMAIGLVLAGLVGIGPASAKDYCQTLGNHQVCILRIERSAKNYWEYRARVKIDGQTQPPATYDCQRRLQRPKNGPAIPFETDGAGDAVCKALKP